jgi:hypothetical protein
MKLARTTARFLGFGRHGSWSGAFVSMMVTEGYSRQIVKKTVVVDAEIRRAVQPDASWTTVEFESPDAIDVLLELNSYAVY